MSVQVVIPFRPENPKTRLSCILEQDEREEFAAAMLFDVVESVREAGMSPLLLSTEEYEFSDLPVIISRRGLNEDLNFFLDDFKGPVAILMADLAIADAESIRRLAATAADMSIVPGKGGGTNAVFMKQGNLFRAHYYGASFLKHANFALDSGLAYDITDSFRLHIDVDEKEDLVEVLMHNNGRSRQYLKDAGIVLEINKGRVGVKRE